MAKQLNPIEVSEKLEELEGINAGVLNSMALVFDKKEKRYTKAVTANEAFSLGAGSVPESYIQVTVTGNSVNNLSFPGGWVVKGDAYNNTKIQEMVFKYTGTYVIVVITTLN
jgi:hypothetical protein